MVTLPSKKAQSIIVLTIGIVIALVLMFNQSKVEQGRKSLNNLITGEKIALPENPNWQQDLGEISTLNTNIDLTSVSTSTNKDTLTDTVSRSLIANYLSLKQQGNLDQTSMQSLITQTVGYLDSMGIQKVDSASLKIINDQGTSTMRSYGDRLGSIILVNKPANIQNELKVLQDAVSSRNKEKIKDLEKIALIYMQIANDLKKMPVPQTFEKSHADIVNSLMGMSVSVNEMSKVFEDPMRGLTGMQAYQQNASTYMAAIKATSNFLRKNKISYKQGSGGYYILNGI